MLSFDPEIPQLPKILPQSAFGRIKSIEVWDFNDDPFKDNPQQRTGKKIYERGIHKNMITNLGLRGWADRALCENFCVCAAGTGQTRDVRYPAFTLTPGTNITQRTGNTVQITGTTDTTLFDEGDTLHYVNPIYGDFLILSRTISSGNLSLVLLNADGTDPSGTTPTGEAFFIFRTSQTGLETEGARSGRPSFAGAQKAAESDASTASGFIAAGSDGPHSPGSGASASAVFSGGQVTQINVNAPGVNFVDFAPPRVVLVGGGAGKMITGNVTSSLSSSGQILNPGSAYSTTPGDVTLQVTGPGRNATFICTVNGSGELTGIQITAEGEAYFADEYSTAAGNIKILDATGSGSGANVVLTPRRQARAFALVSSGSVSNIVLIYPGNQLQSAPTVLIYPSSYMVHERTFAFEPESSGTKNYSEIGFSHAISPGNNLFSRIVLRSSSTGAVSPITVQNGQQLRVTYQLIVNYVPTVATTLESGLVGGWGLQGGAERMERIGVSTVRSDGRTSWADEGYHLNEPYSSTVNQLGFYDDNSAPIQQAVNQIQLFISDSDTAHSGGWGTQVDRDNGTWSYRGITAPEKIYVNNNTNLYPIKIRKRATWSIAAGNNVTSIRSWGSAIVRTGVTNAGLTGPVIDGIGWSYVHNAAANNQASGNGRPEKLNTHTLQLGIEYRIGRTLSV